ncbi:MAG: hypothetical protein AAF686_04175 [Pseudomonadota bacterium]
MTRLNASLEMALRGIEFSSRDQSLLRDLARIRWVEAGAELTLAGPGPGERSLSILVQGCLSLVRRRLPDEAARDASDQKVNLAAHDQPVLIPPPHPRLRLRSETDVDLIEFRAIDCALLLVKCRAFRALVFAAANSGISQLSDRDLPVMQSPDDAGPAAVPRRPLH